MKRYLYKVCLVIMVIMGMFLSLCGCSDDDEESRVSKADKQSDTAKQKYLSEIGKTTEGEKIVCFQKGETYETYYIASFKNDKMVKRTEYRLYYDREVNGKKCFDIDLEYYKQQQDFKKADTDLKVAIFEADVPESENSISYDEWYNDRVNAEYEIIE